MITIHMLISWIFLCFFFNLFLLYFVNLILSNNFKFESFVRVFLFIIHICKIHKFINFFAVFFIFSVYGCKEKLIFFFHFCCSYCSFFCCCYFFSQDYNNNGVENTAKKKTHKTYLNF